MILHVLLLCRDALQIDSRTHRTRQARAECGAWPWRRRTETGQHIYGGGRGGTPSPLAWRGRRTGGSELGRLPFRARRAGAKAAAPEGGGRGWWGFGIQLLFYPSIVKIN